MFCHVTARFVAYTGDENAPKRSRPPQMEGKLRMIWLISSARRDTRQILIDQAAVLRAQAQKMPPGVERDRLIKQARQLDAEAKAGNWANSAALQSPT